MGSGIYLIRNKINGKVYVGKTKNFKQRWYQYEYDYKKQRVEHINQYLLSSMNKYGFYNFEFSVLEYCSLDKCSERELYWMTYYNSFDPEFGYNLRVDTSTGMVVHELTSIKISERLKREWSNGTRSEHSNKMKESWSNRNRSTQSDIMTKNLTKYVYKVIDDLGNTEELLHRQLKELGLANVISEFHRKKTDKVKWKQYTIERVRINE